MKHISVKSKERKLKVFLIRASRLQADLNGIIFIMHLEKHGEKKRLAPGNISVVFMLYL